MRANCDGLIFFDDGLRVFAAPLRLAEPAACIVDQISPQYVGLEVRPVLPASA